MSNIITTMIKRLHRPRADHGAGMFRHCVMFSVDISGFSGYPSHMQVRLRRILYRIMEDACEASGLPWQNCRHEDRGDGILVIVECAADYIGILNRFPANVCAAIRAYNSSTDGTAKIRLRMSIHDGYVQPDQHGFTGPDVIHLCRLLDAPALKRRLVDHEAHFALIISDHIHRIAADFGFIDPRDYQPITVKFKETEAPAWIRLPPRERPDGD